ncbi:hypothetical protein F0249_19190 [Vibrio sp. 03-59-1]|uniref:hypothetical protein n=1 Tax=Vibrio sp. 03-59-1 TaxID=2607607 RepID=UPI00149384DB|nr:hypothetical protein [Vibrio sp. 03-59-1]NOH85915.1 hypothetical protein [Vibrio sp. 03-59-1]
MNHNVLAAFVIGFFCFFMGRNWSGYKFDWSDSGTAIMAVWAVVGCTYWLFSAWGTGTFQ